MAPAPEPLTLKLIFDAGVAVMAALSGGFKHIAPPEMPKVWVFLATVGASGAFFTAKLFVGFTGVHVSRDLWLGLALVVVWLAIVVGVVYVLARSRRTVTYEGEVRLAGTDAEYLPGVAADPQNAGKTREDLVYDAAGVVRDVHFALNRSDLSPDAVILLKDNAEILEGVFKDFAKATVIVEGYCDDRGTDEYNLVLGYQRAEAARQALLAAKIDGSRLTVSSHGKKESTCQLDEESCRRNHRRVHLTAIQN